MNWKIVFVGGFVYYLVFLLLSFVGGAFIHSPEGVLGPLYREFATFWRPELNATPPDMVGLLKIWVPVGLLSSFLLAGVFSVIRSSFAGSGLARGVKFGVVSWIFALISALGYWGLFNLPNKIWAWWLIEGIWMHLAAGAVLGFVADKLSPTRS